MKYYFRGRKIMEYDPKFNDLRVFTEAHDNFNMCSFIDEDWDLFIQFFQKIKDFRKGKIKEEELTDIEVD